MIDSKFTKAKQRKLPKKITKSIDVKLMQSLKLGSSGLDSFQVSVTSNFVI